MRKAGRWGALVAVTALSFPALLDLSHHDEFVHAICPEHGELVHVTPSRSTTAPEQGWWSQGAKDGAHEHCELSWLRSDELTPHPESSPLASPEFRLRILAPDLEPRSQRALDYAPKASPPR